MKLIVENLCKSYKDNIVLKDVNFTFESGKIYGLIGRNGAGKTTLFNSINKDIDIDSGKVLLDKEFLRDINTNDIGYVVSESSVPEFLTAKEFLTFFLEINKDKIKDMKSIDYYFNLVDIKKEDQDKLLKEYSSGMKNKIQMLTEIILLPDVLLLDEPLTSLDVVVQDDMKKLLKKIKDNRIIIFSTHILEIAMDLCDEIVIINNKKLEKIEKKDLDTKKYKDKIIKCLKDSKND